MSFPQVVHEQDWQTQDSQTQDLQTQDLQAQDLQTQSVPVEEAVVLEVLMDADDDVRPFGEEIALVSAGAVDEELRWQERALCAQTDPEAFFPEKGGSTREAKKVCLGCDVRPECLEYALSADERFGIWGGLSERERRRLRKLAV